MLASNGVFAIKLSNEVSQILKGPSLVAMATKFETKRDITQLVWGNITQMLAPSMVFWQLMDAPCIAPSRVTQMIFARPRRRRISPPYRVKFSWSRSRR